ncbi:MAG TPA: sigma-70 family RNA polymerase sigma factor [Pirellulales bacterium]|nr:sigma-70 family RNA polymerase sigma factor [Pirellulales bacterium]
MADEIRLLVDGCRRGDQRAMAALVDRFRDRVFGLCLRMVRHRQDAEDATQETFVRALRSLANWDAERDFQPWLLAIAGNRCRTLLATRMRRPAMQNTVEQLPDAGADAQRAGALREELELALSGLRDEYRQAFVLFHQGQLSHAEIAEVLDCPVGTVKTWVHRARLELAQRLRQRGIVQELPHAMP